MPDMELEDRFTVIDNPDGAEGQQWFSHEQTLAFPLRRVWTVVEGDSGTLWALNGYHVVNRVYYLVTAEEWTDADEDVDYWWASMKEEA